MPNVKVNKYDKGVTDTIEINKKPDKCPRCHQYIAAIPRTSYFSADDEAEVVDLVFQCTSQKCGRTFFAEYVLVSTDYWEYTISKPYETERRTFNVEIEEVSPEFTEIYNQAFAAQSLGMSHIAGMGFGKALEFLIKDFAIKQRPDKKEEIKNLFLGVCLKNYIDDQNVKDVAERASWLRNDQAHYVRKWSDRDIEDLKTLLTLTVNAIQNIELAAKFKREMLQGKK